MIKGFILGIIVTLVGAAGVGYLILISGQIPANADAKPGAIEDFITQTSLSATLEKEAPKGDNPVALTDDNLVAAIDLYGKNCAICHGTAEGDASASPIAKGEYPNPRSWRPMAWKTIRKAGRFGKSNMGYDGLECLHGGTSLPISKSEHWRYS